MKVKERKKGVETGEEDRENIWKKWNIKEKGERRRRNKKIKIIWIIYKRKGYIVGIKEVKKKYKNKSRQIN